MTTRALPLFPLHTVLFPGVSLPLRVFEDRYRQMIKRCLVEDRVLGIVLIRSGSEVGAPAIPFEVGTLARILVVDNQSDGTINLGTIGESRFRIRQIDQSRPYAVAEVDILEEDPPEVSERLVQDVRDQFTEYVQTLRRLARRAETAVRLPGDLIALSYLVATNLQISRVEQQRLLEDSATRRLQRENDVLRRELTMLRRIGAVTTRRVLAPSDIPLN